MAISFYFDISRAEVCGLRLVVSFIFLICSISPVFGTDARSSKGAEDGYRCFLALSKIVEIHTEGDDLEPAARALLAITRAEIGLSNSPERSHDVRILAQSILNGDAVVFLDGKEEVERFFQTVSEVAKLRSPHLYSLMLGLLQYIQDQIGKATENNVVIFDGTSGGDSKSSPLDLFIRTNDEGLPTVVFIAHHSDTPRPRTLRTVPAVLDVLHTDELSDRIVMYKMALDNPTPRARERNRYLRKAKSIFDTQRWIPLRDRDPKFELYVNVAFELSGTLGFTEEGERFFNELSEAGELQHLVDRYKSLSEQARALRSAIVFGHDIEQIMDSADSLDKRIFGSESDGSGIDNPSAFEDDEDVVELVKADRKYFDASPYHHRLLEYLDLLLNHRVPLALSRDKVSYLREILCITVAIIKMLQQPEVQDSIDRRELFEVLNKNMDSIRDRIAEVFPQFRYIFAAAKAYDIEAFQYVDFLVTRDFNKILARWKRDRAG